MASFDQLLSKFGALLSGGNRAPTNAMAGAGNVAESLEPQVEWRGSMLPIVNYDDGTGGFGWPQMAVDAKNAMGRFGRTVSAALGDEWSPEETFPRPEDAVLPGLAVAGAGLGHLGLRGRVAGSVRPPVQVEMPHGLPSHSAEAGSTPITARVYRGTGYPEGKIDPRTREYFASDNPDIAATYADGPTPAVFPSDVTFRNPLVVDVGGGLYDEVPGHGTMYNTVEAAKQAGNDGVVFRNIVDPMRGDAGPVATTYAALKPGTVKSATTGETLFSNPPEAAPAGLLATGEGEAAEHHSRSQPRNPSGQFVTSDSFDGRLSAFEKVLIDLDGDGVPDAVAPEPVNAFAALRRR